MNDGGGDGAGCFDIKEWADTTELTNVEVAGLGKCSYLVAIYDGRYMSVCLSVCLSVCVFVSK